MCLPPSVKQETRHRGSTSFLKSEELCCEPEGRVESSQRAKSPRVYVCLAPRGCGEFRKLNKLGEGATCNSLSKD